MRRVSIVLLSLLLMLSLFAACSPETTETTEQPTSSSQDGTTTTTTKASETEAKKDPVTLNFFSSVGAYKVLLEEMVADWNATVGAEKGITVQMETNIDNYQEALQLLIQAGNSPDVFSGPSAAAIKSGWIAPLDDIPEVQETLTVFKDSLITGVNIVDGKTYSVPFFYQPVKFAYNKDLFVKNGIVDENGEAKPPKTLEEMVEYAKTITDNGGGKEYGYGYTFGWSATTRRFLFKSFTMTTGSIWFDNTNGEYNFEPFTPMYEAIKQMYDDGSWFPGYETISIDAIRAQFAEGNIGMICALGYDIGVYNNQFPAQIDWGVCDPPQVSENPPYKGVCYVRDGDVISSTVAAEDLWAAGEFWSFLNGVEMKAKLYATGNIIPTSQVVVQHAIDNDFEFVDLKNWDVMSDISNYVGTPPYPDTLLVLEGDNYHLAFQQYVMGNTTLEAMIEDLNTRYNAAYQQGVEDGTIEDAVYHSPVDLSR